MKKASSRLTSKSKPKQCPKCGSKRVVKIIFGFPAPELMDEAEAGKVALGGCCVTGDDPSWRCLDCKVDIYRVAK